MHCRSRIAWHYIWSDYDDSSDHCDKLRQNYIFLLENMEITHSPLVAQLYDSDVLDLREKEDIEAEPTSTRRNQKLLSVLSRKSVEQFQQFLAAPARFRCNTRD